MKAKRKRYFLIMLIIFLLTMLFLSACTGKIVETAEDCPTVSAVDEMLTGTPVGEVSSGLKPTEMLESTPELTAMPKPTVTFQPTASPSPTETPVEPKNLADRIIVRYEGEKVAQEDTWLFLIEHNGKKGAINQYGEVVVEPIYDYLHEYSEGMAVFWSDKKKKYGFIDEKGNVVVPPIFDWVENFSEGLAVVEINRLWGYIDKTGNYKIEPKYQAASSFSEGLAWVYKKTETETESEKESRRVVITPEEEEVLILLSRSAVNKGEFHDGLAAVRFDYMFLRYTGYMDKTGKLAFISDGYGRELPLRDFCEGFAIMYVEKEDESLNKMYVDVNGEILGGYEFEEAEDFSEGLAYAERDGICGYIDTTGEFVLTGIDAGDGSCPFHGGLAACRKDGKYGFIDKTGEFVIAPVYDSYWDEGFENGYAVVSLDGVRICINEAGEEMWRLYPEEIVVEDTENMEETR